MAEMGSAVSGGVRDVFGGEWDDFGELRFDFGEVRFAFGEVRVELCPVMGFVSSMTSEYLAGRAAFRLGRSEVVSIGPGEAFWLLTSKRSFLAGLVCSSIGDGLLRLPTWIFDVGSDMSLERRGGICTNCRLFTCSRAHSS